MKIQIKISQAGSPRQEYLYKNLRSGVYSDGRIKFRDYYHDITIGWIAIRP